MASFDYLAIDVDGVEREGAVSAADAQSAGDALRARSWVVVRLQPAERRRPGARARRVPAKALALVTRQLATLAEVTPLEEALASAAAQSADPRLKRALVEAHAHLVEGHRFSEALGQVDGAFPPLYRAMVAAGEGAGALPAVLDRLATLLEAQQALRAKLVAALVYPAALMLTAGAVVAALMAFVVPRIAEQFASMGRELPWLTRAVIAVSEAVSVALLPALGLAIVVALGVQLARRHPRHRLRLDAALLQLPLLGRLLRDAHAARMARTLATMVASGLPLLEGLRITASTLDNLALRKATEAMADAVREGGSLSTAMRRARLFPPTLLHLASSGEESGRLAPLLERAADYLDREFDTLTGTFIALLEPAIIVVLGGVVAAIVLSILLPILQFNQLVLA